MGDLLIYQLPLKTVKEEFSPNKFSNRLFEIFEILILMLMGKICKLVTFLALPSRPERFKEPTN